jgi:uncharacterized SAM-binding protein YcdF (DUF218 family)
MLNWLLFVYFISLYLLIFFPFIFGQQFGKFLENRKKQIVAVYCVFAIVILLSSVFKERPRNDTDFSQEYPGR